MAEDRDNIRADWLMALRNILINNGVTTGGADQFTQGQVVTDPKDRRRIVTVFVQELGLLGRGKSATFPHK
jgi:hypothetical protein